MPRQKCPHLQLCKHRSLCKGEVWYSQCTYTAAYRKEFGQEQSELLTNEARDKYGWNSGDKRRRPRW